MLSLPVPVDLGSRFIREVKAEAEEEVEARPVLQTES